MATVANPENRFTVQKLAYPETVQRRRFIWPYLGAFVVYHAVALLAVLPWLFNWGSVAVCVAGFYVFGTLGINLCFHRLLTHSSFKCPKWLEHFLAILGVCCLQDTPARWIAVHRKHHQHSDEQPDPHSPLVGFFWGHMDWLVRHNDDLERLDLYERYAKDILRDRFYLKLERNLMWVWINLAQWAVFYLAGFAIGWATGESWLDGVQLGLSLLVWGVFVRTVCVWHITWSVNSLSHMWGYRNYETDENSRNNVFVGLVSNGEGWHNNHHADPRSARHGHRWWELDNTWLTIRVLAFVGLAKDVVPPSAHLAKQATGSKLTTRGGTGVPE
jgi:stearoyl-CoA desaturase (delta-9 desaturase)